MKLTYKIASSILCGISVLVTATSVFADADDTSDILKALKAERSQAYNNSSNKKSNNNINYYNDTVDDNSENDSNSKNNNYKNNYNSQINDKNQIVIDIDYMEGFTLHKPAGQIVIGNPVIADITVRDDQYIFISGKSPGRTNMLIYGRDGSLQERYTILVRDPNTYLTVYTGAENKLHYDCLPQCQRVLRIEDKGTDAESQRAKISSQLEMIDGRAQKAKAAEMTPEQEQ